jgi:glutamate---cysteine ligase / carboxylate-amine ligase
MERTDVKPRWAEWRPHASGAAYTVGVEEEVMLLDPQDWSLAQEVDRVLTRMPPDMALHVTPETHKCAVELATGVHSTVEGAIDELASLRAALEERLGPMGLAAASAGTHPSAVWQDTVVSSGTRYEAVYGSMRELARREPTFALHVHVGVRDPEQAICLANRLRAHVPPLLALSANSPFWQGRDTGLASARTPLFQAFPRVGIPRAFGSYGEYVEVVDLLIRNRAFPEPTFLWWDVRLQPRFGTVEVRIMDAQTRVDDSLALVALVQALARLECEEGYAADALVHAPEVLEENRFLAARDGVSAELIDPAESRRVPLRELVDRLLDAAGPHARELGCADALDRVPLLLERSGAVRQLDHARGPGRLPGLVAEMARSFAQRESAG